MKQYIIKDDIIEYKKDTAEVSARIIGETKDGIKEKWASYAQKFSFKKGLKIFDNKGEDSATSEVYRLYKQNCFGPILVKDLTTS